jgi:tRNA threonylcarbamoyladenosine biosynthesis protein TsaB
MIILAVDTTTFAGSVAVLEKTRLIAEVNIDSSATHSERLISSVDFVLKANSLSIQDMDGFAVSSGPGSFTGIRIGLSTIKAFSHASGKPVAMVSTLKALAWKLRHPQSRLLCPVLDAKRGEIFAALFESKEGSLQEVVAQGAYSPDRFLTLLPSNRIIFFIGNGLDVYRDKIFDYFKDKARFSLRSPFIAYEVGLIGYALLKEKKGVKAQEIEPLYLRKSQAEEKN